MSDEEQGGRWSEINANAIITVCFLIKEDGHELWMRSSVILRKLNAIEKLEGKFSKMNPNTITNICFLIEEDGY